MDNSKKYDLIVVGAGPAGSTTAKYAALAGMNVLHNKHLLEGSLRFMGARGMHQILRCQFPFLTKFER